MKTQEYIRGLKSFKSFTEDIKNERLFHSIMLINRDGEFLRAYSKMLAGEILSVGRNDSSSTLNKVEKEIHPGLIILGREKPIDAEESKAVVASSLVAPFEGDRKVYIIERFDEIQASPANKLLKTLEEPPSGVVFILLVKNEARVLQTLKSRSQKFYLEGFSSEIISGILCAEGQANCELISIQSGNNLEKARKLVQGGNSSELSKFVVNVFHNLKKTTDLLKFSSLAENFKDDHKEMFSFFASVAEMAMRRKAGLDDNLPKNILAEVDKISSEWTYLGLVGVIEASLLSLKMLEAYVQSSNCIDSFFLKILEVRRKCKQ